MSDFDLNSSTFEFNVDEKVRPTLERKLLGRTKTDVEIDSLSIPSGPIHIRLSIGLIRLYRNIRPAFIGNRCVFEPSCSRYSELAIRQNGLLIGIWLTVKRLYRCRPGNGGLDLLIDKEK